MRESSCGIFLEAFVQLRNATVSFVLSVRPSSFYMEQLGFRGTDFHDIL